MKVALLRPGGTNSPLDNEDRCAHWRPRIRRPPPVSRSILYPAGGGSPGRRLLTALSRGDLKVLVVQVLRPLAPEVSRILAELRRRLDWP